ncbi:MAG: hypothetical protein LUC32_06165, partial [Clostridiales bacterium]|nr:hypothetical protein [Clostridiales bacterium]
IISDAPYPSFFILCTIFRLCCQKYIVSGSEISDILLLIFYSKRAKKYTAACHMSGSGVRFQTIS